LSELDAPVVDADAVTLGLTRLSTPSAASVHRIDHAACAARRTMATQMSPGAARSAVTPISTCAAAKAMRPRTHQ
jgi:hypothetical protein